MPDPSSRRRPGCRAGSRRPRAPRSRRAGCAPRPARGPGATTSARGCRRARSGRPASTAAGDIGRVGLVAQLRGEVLDGGVALGVGQGGAGCRGGRHARRYGRAGRPAIARPASVARNPAIVGPPHPVLSGDSDARSEPEPLPAPRGGASSTSRPLRQSPAFARLWIGTAIRASGRSSRSSPSACRSTTSRGSTFAVVAGRRHRPGADDHRRTLGRHARRRVRPQARADRQLGRSAGPASSGSSPSPSTTRRSRGGPRSGRSTCSRPSTPSPRPSRWRPARRSRRACCRRPRPRGERAQRHLVRPAVDGRAGARRRAGRDRRILLDLRRRRAAVHGRLPRRPVLPRLPPLHETRAARAAVAREGLAFLRRAPNIRAGSSSTSSRWDSGGRTCCSRRSARSSSAAGRSRSGSSRGGGGRHLPHQPVQRSGRAGALSGTRHRVSVMVYGGFVALFGVTVAAMQTGWFGPVGADFAGSTWSPWSSRRSPWPAPAPPTRSARSSGRR